jgi:hypothetical protein
MTGVKEVELERWNFVKRVFGCVIGTIIGNGIGDIIRNLARSNLGMMRGSIIFVW